jgi:DNA-binding PadR family transcriptional regulator
MFTEGIKMDDLARRVLNIFTQMKNDTLDLHTLLEAGGNDPAAREQVIEVVARLSREGFLEERGSDFYTLTDKGQEALR